MAVDADCDVLIADTFNGVARGVAPDGTISTVAQVGSVYQVVTDPSATGVKFYTVSPSAVEVSGAVESIPVIPTGTPTLDGRQDAIWDASPVEHIAGNSSPITADVRLLWDDNYLYYLAEVQDSTACALNPTAGQYPDNGHLGEHDDAVEAWINWTDSASASYFATSGAVASHYVSDRNDVGTNFPPPSTTSDISTIKTKVVSDASGYTVEAAVPWPSAGTAIPDQLQLGRPAPPAPRRALKVSGHQFPIIPIDLVA